MADSRMTFADVRIRKDSDLEMLFPFLNGEILASNRISEA
jgi:hypothetical protein